MTIFSSFACFLIIFSAMSLVISWDLLTYFKCHIQVSNFANSDFCKCGIFLKKHKPAHEFNTVAEMQCAWMSPSDQATCTASRREKNSVCVVTVMSSMMLAVSVAIFLGFPLLFFGFRFRTELPCFFLDQIKAWCWYDIQLLVSLNFFMWNIDKSHLTDFLKSYFVDRVTHCVVNGYCIACCWIDTFYRHWWDLLWRFAI